MAEMKTRHTPGPWRWGRTTRNTGTGAMEGDLQLVTDHRPIPLNDPVVFTVREDWTRHLLRHPEGQANARLIAKAPELLAIVRAVVEVLDADGIQYGDSDVEALDALREARALLAEIDGGD